MNEKLPTQTPVQMPNLQALIVTPQPIVTSPTVAQIPPQTLEPLLQVKVPQTVQLQIQAPQIQTPQQQAPQQQAPLEQTQTVLTQPARQTLTQLADPKDVRTETYTDKSFVIRGTGTILYPLQLTSLGGKWNKNLRGGGGWIFSNKKTQKATTWIQNVQSGLVQPDDPEQIKAVRAEKRQRSPRATTGITTTTTTIAITAATNPDMQSVQWTVFRPRVHMKARLKVGQVVAEYDVGRVEEHNGVVDTAFIHPSGHPTTESKLVICNGAWQVWGYAEDHSVFFQ